MRTSRNYYFFKKLKEKHIPLHVQIELTTRCNNKCVHCIREKDMKSELTSSEIKKVISQLAEAGCMQLTFTGGEPLLREDFFDISSFARSRGLVLRLFSNATLINSSVAKKLKKMKFKEVRISLFASNEKIHDSITKNSGSFKKTLKAIAFLQENEVPFHLYAVIMKQNIYELIKLGKKAEEEDWKFSCDPTIYPTYTSAEYPLLNRITDREVEYLKEKRLFNEDWTKYRDIQTKWHELSCFYLGNLHCYISADGRVFPHATVRLELGNLKRQSLKEIWRNSLALNRLRNLSIDDFECSRCNLFFNCPLNLGLALSEHGRITAKPKEYCRIVSIMRKEKCNE